MALLPPVSAKIGDFGPAADTSCLKISDDGHSDRLIYVQVSTVNDYLLHALGIPAWRPTLRRRLMTRLFIAWGGLHSDQSGKLDLVLRRPAAKALPVLAVRAVPDPNTRAVVKQAIRRLSRTLVRAGAVALSPATLIRPPGGETTSGDRCRCGTARKARWRPTH
jgi:hypothetical protein